MLTKDEAQRIALCVSSLRPDWSTNGLMSVLADDRCRHRVPRDLTLAFVALALDPTSRKPTRIFEAGPWWDVTKPVGPTVQQYRVITADDCGVCYRPASLHSKLSPFDDHEWEPQRFGQGVGPTPEQKAAIQAARVTSPWISDADLTHIRERHEAITQDELETTAAPDESEKA